MRDHRRRIGLATAVAVLGAAAITSLLAATAGSTATGPGLLPDLRTVVPAHMQIVNQQQRDLLRFSNGIANTGAGPLALRPETVGLVTNGIQEIRDVNGNVVSERLASQYEFHPAHNHWHLGDVALFEVRRGSPTGPVAVGQLDQGHVLPDRLVPRSRATRQHEGPRVLRLRDELPGDLGGLGRPVPPFARRPAARPHERAEQHRPLPRQHRELQRQVPGDHDVEQHRVGAVPAPAGVQRESQARGARQLPMRIARDVRRGGTQPLTR